MHWFGKVPKFQLQERYHLGDTTIDRILAYEAPERKRPNRVGKPKTLSDAQVDVIIEYCSENYEQRCLDYNHLVLELKLKVIASTLQRRLHQRGYYRCVACQKPYLTATQVIGRLLWAIAHIFWHEEWLKVLWSDEVTFLVGGRTVKRRVTRNKSERTNPICIQHQFHRSHTTPINAWGAIRYGYKSPLLFIYSSGKKGAFTQKDYLAQVLETQLTPILEAFAAITHLLHPATEPLFMEDSNSAHGHKSTTNCCQRFCTKHGIILMPHPSTSPDINPIEKC